MIFVCPLPARAATEGLRVLPGADSKRIGLLMRSRDQSSMLALYSSSTVASSARKGTEVNTTSKELSTRQRYLQDQMKASRRVLGQPLPNIYAVSGGAGKLHGYRGAWSLSTG